MFLLSLLAFLWMFSVFVAFVTSTVHTLWGQTFVLKSAEIVVCNAVQEPDTMMHAVDVMKEMMLLQTRRPVKLKLLSHMMSVAFRGDLRQTLTRCNEAGHQGNPRVRKSPICFLDIRYATNKTSSTQTYRCLYPLYSFSDYVYYPPKCTWSSWKPNHPSWMKSAVLTLRYDGESTRQLSCNVLDRLRGLEGPFGDFHRKSQSGYQLRKHILRIVLMSDIKALAESFEHANDENLEGSKTTTSTTLTTSTTSTSSTTAIPASIRCQFRMSNNRVEVIHLKNS